MKGFAGKKVLMLLENNPYPLDSRVRQEAKTLVNVGYQVSVICPRGNNQPWIDCIDEVSIFRYPPPPELNNTLGYLIEYSYSLIAAFLVSLFVWAYRGFDIIHTANPPDSAVFIAIFYRLFGKLFIFDHHDLVPEMYIIRSPGGETSLVYRTLLWMEKITFKYAHHVITTNQSYKEIAIQRGHVPPERVTIVRNGPLLDRLKTVEQDTELKKKGSVILGYIGVMGPQDGVDYLLRALNLLVNQLGMKDFYCVIIGKGIVLSDLKNLAKQLGLDQYVWFTGYIPDSDMIRYLSTIDIGLDPDPSNCFNDRCTMIKMMEYMSFGKPIVAFDLPEHRVTAREAALYAKPNEELQFAEEIKSLISDPSLRVEMGLIGRKRVEDELAWSFQAKHLLEAYDYLLKTNQ